MPDLHEAAKPNRDDLSAQLIADRHRVEPLGILRNLAARWVECRDTLYALRWWDAYHLADAMAAELDETPIDEAFVRSLGPTIRDDKSCVIVVLESRAKWCRIRAIWTHKDVIAPAHFELAIGRDHSHEAFLGERIGVAMNVGQFRTLCRALQIDLKEQP